MPTPTTRPFLTTLLALAAAAAVAGCESGSATDDSTEPSAMSTPTSADTTLASTLEQRKAEFRASAPQEMQTLFADGIEDVRRQGSVARSKNVGDQAPAFTLTDHNDRPVSLGSLLANGPVVLTWYRGGWCPYCNLALRAFQQRLDEFDELGATLVALTPELPDRSLSTKEKNELDFVVLSDLENKVARDYGVVFSLTEGVHDKYNELFQFDGFNGNSSGELPLAATYVIDTDGVIRWAFLDEDYTKRAEPSDVLAALRALR